MFSIRQALPKSSQLIAKRFYHNQLPSTVRIVEVGLRDGLQNEKKLVTLETKLTLLDKLYAAGLRTIEAGSFVSPKWVPQMKDTADIFAYLKQHANTKFPEATFTALTPNVKGKFFPPNIMFSYYL